LRGLAQENRARLDASATALETLAGEVRENAAAIQALAEASAEIRNFVALVQKMARQSKLLALNAAMEAARAGAQGEGFAVVASEVRRLAASSNEAAQRTEQLVTHVLQRVEESRDASARSVETVRTVMETTQATYESFGYIEQAVAEADRWTVEIEQAASSSNDLVNHITRRLESVARGTEAFAAAMEEVAATSQQQSASTQEIAGAAEKLNAAADRLAALVATFRTVAGESPDPEPPPPEPAELRGPRHTPVMPMAELLEA
jgi:methyl-accepting chemotaxis protein